MLAKGEADKYIVAGGLVVSLHLNHNKLKRTKDGFNVTGKLDPKLLELLKEYKPVLLELYDGSEKVRKLIGLS